MKKWICNFSIFIITLIIIWCIFCIITGSLEMFPTEEQIVKVRLVYSLFAAIFLILDIVLVIERLKLGKKNINK